MAAFHFRPPGGVSNHSEAAMMLVWSSTFFLRWVVCKLSTLFNALQRRNVDFGRWRCVTHLRRYRHLISRHGFVQIICRNLRLSLTGQTLFDALHCVGNSRKTPTNCVLGGFRTRQQDLQQLCHRKRPFVVRFPGKLQDEIWTVKVCFLTALNSFYWIK